VTVTQLEVGMTLTPRRVLIEQGPVSVFASVVGADVALHSSSAAARAAGFDGVPVPPTYPFVMWFLGSHPDLQDDDSEADLRDLRDVSAALAAGGGMILHGEQEFRYHRPLLVGETVLFTGVIDEVTEKRGSDGRLMRFAKVRTEAIGADGKPAVTQVSTLLCVH